MNASTRYAPRNAGGARSTLPVRLELEATADRLADEASSADTEFYRLEALAAAARDRWATLDLERAAVERALVELPVYKAPEHENAIAVLEEARDQAVQKLEALSGQYRDVIRSADVARTEINAQQTLVDNYYRAIEALSAPTLSQA